MKILTYTPFSASSESNLQQAGFEIITIKVAQEQLKKYISENQIDAIIIDQNTTINEEIIDNCPSLKLIGYSNPNSNIDNEYAVSQGIIVINALESSSNAIAEMVFAHLFGMVRFLHQSNREMPLEGETKFKVLQNTFTGNELKNKALGVIGFDHSTIETIRIAIGIGMRVQISNHESKSISVPVSFFDGQEIEFQFETVTLNEVLKNSDFISLHTTEIDSCILSTAEFEQMKTNVGIINCTNQESIDEIALIEAIRNKKLKYSGLDSFNNQPKPEIQILMNPELSLSPNISRLTVEAKERADIELSNKIIQSLL